MSEPIPSDQTPDERIEWIIKRGQMMDDLLEGEWVADDIETLWNNPHEFENGDLDNHPDNGDDRLYILFRLGVLFGTDYEYYFPRDNKDKWVHPGKDNE